MTSFQFGSGTGLFDNDECLEEEVSFSNGNSRTVFEQSMSDDDGDDGEDDDDDFDDDDLPENCLDRGTLALLYNELRLCRLTTSAEALKRELDIKSIQLSGNPPRLKQLVEFWNSHHEIRAAESPGGGLVPQVATISSSNIPIRVSGTEPITSESIKKDLKKLCANIRDGGEKRACMKKNKKKSAAIGSGDEDDNMEGGNDDPERPLQKTRGPWLVEEEDRLRIALEQYGFADIEKLATVVQTRSSTGVSKHLTKTRRGWGPEQNTKMFEALLCDDPTPNMALLMATKPSDRSERELVNWLEWFIIHNMNRDSQTVPFGLGYSVGSTSYQRSLDQVLLDNNGTGDREKRVKLMPWSEDEERQLRDLIISYKGDIVQASQQLENRSVSDVMEHLKDLKDKDQLTGSLALHYENAIVSAQAHQVLAKKSQRGRWTLEEVRAFDAVFAKYPHDFDALCKAVPQRTRDGVALRMRKLNERAEQERKERQAAAAAADSAALERKRMRKREKRLAAAQAAPAQNAVAAREASDACMPEQTMALAARFPGKGLSRSMPNEEEEEEESLGGTADLTHIKTSPASRSRRGSSDPMLEANDEDQDIINGDSDNIIH